jgi:hypothetical protein
MGAFTIWNWFLALKKGQGAVEFFFNSDPRNNDCTYRITSMKENLYIAFGTMNIFKVLLPVDREKPLNGLEWTYVKNLEGKIKIGSDNEEEDEEMNGKQNKD